MSQSARFNTLFFHPFQMWGRSNKAPLAVGRNNFCFAGGCCKQRAKNLLPFQGANELLKHAELGSLTGQRQGTARRVRLQLWQTSGRPRPSIIAGFTTGLEKLKPQTANLTRAPLKLRLLLFSTISHYDMSMFWLDCVRPLCCYRLRRDSRLIVPRHWREGGGLGGRLGWLGSALMIRAGKLSATDNPRPR